MGWAAGCSTLPQKTVALPDIPAAQAGRARENLRIFYAVWDLVNRKHYDIRHQGVDWEQLAETFGPKAAAASNDVALYQVLNQMVAQLQDSHTRVLLPVQAEERHTQRRVRTGFNLTRMEGRWLVTEVMPGTPAATAGVKPGWIAVARNGEALGNLIDFRPNEGEVATWDFLDERDQRVSVAAKATRLSIASRQLAQELPGGYVYLRFDEFDGPDRRWLGAQLQMHHNAPGVVIDLRRNPGGETFSLGITIGEFFDHQVNCGTFISRRGSRSIKNSWQIGSANFQGKVVILVDGATASAAEIFSAVLQDHGRATVIGRKSAGAVLASWFYGLPGGGELQLSREDYLAPKGRRIEGNGVEPDIVVTRTLADLRAGRDPDLDAALRVLGGGR